MHLFRKNKISFPPHSTSNTPPKVFRKEIIISCFLLFLLLPVCMAAASQAQEAAPQGRDSATPASVPAADVQCEKQLLQKLHGIIDPELNVNIVELGLVRKITCSKADKVNTVTIILTTPFCPYIKGIVADIKKESKKISPHSKATVVVDTRTRWKPSMMSPSALEKVWGIKQ